MADKHSSAGFTLIALMTVVAIIAVLIGMVAGIAGYASKKAAMSRAQADMEKIKAAVEEFRAIYGYVPTNSVAHNSSNLTAQLWLKPQKEGRPPLLTMKGWSDSNMVYRLTDPWGNDYRYLRNPDPPYCTNNNTRFGYDLWSLGPDALDGSDDITNWRAGD
jgi:type II secretion system protein G